jgi:hypothetical protein
MGAFCKDFLCEFFWVVVVVRSNWCDIKKNCIKKWKIYVL